MTALANVSAALSQIPNAAVQAGEAALNSAIKAVGLDSSTSEKKEEEDKDGETKDGEDKEGEAKELEEGEIEEGEKGENGVKTVFDDPGSFNVKHPLYSTWTLYFQSPNSKNLPKLPETAAAPPGHSAGAWMDDIKKVVNFDCVEDFWGLYNNIVPPSMLPNKADYFLFRAGIIPAWEDAQNKDGGKWSVQMPKEKTRAQIDKMWLYTMLAAIGETFESDAKDAVPNDQADLITGVIVSSRPNFFRINVWTRQAPENPNEPSPLTTRILNIGKHFKTSVLGYEPDQKVVGSSSGFATEVEFVSHKDSEKKDKVKKMKLTI